MAIPIKLGDLSVIEFKRQCIMSKIALKYSLLTIIIMIVLINYCSDKFRYNRSLYEDTYDVWDEFRKDESWILYDYAKYMDGNYQGGQFDKDNNSLELLFKGGATHFFQNDKGELILYIMQNNKVSNLGFCKGLPIISLCIWSCDNLLDISALRKLPIHNLELSSLKIDDLGVLDGLPLKQLKIEKCPVNDIGVLKNCHRLRKVVLRNVPVEDFSALGCLKLHTVVIEGTLGTDITPIVKSNSLKYLKVGCGRVRCVNCE